MASVGSRIKKRRKELGISAELVAEKIGVSRATYYRYECDESTKISYDVMDQIADILQTTRFELTGTENQREKWIKENTIPILKITYLPIIGTVRAGSGGITYEDNLGQEFIETSSLKGHSSEDFFWTKVKGDSMEPRLFEDDLVLVKKQTSVDSGSYAVVLIDDEEGVVKKITYDDNSITLHSQNHNYPPRTFVGKEVLRVRVVGQVVKSQSTF